MPKYKYNYLIIGGGMTADSVVSGIREVDPDGSIGVISMEGDVPYDRPPLTKSLWKDKALETIWRHTNKERVQFHLERTIEKIEVKNKGVIDSHGDVYNFEKLLLATGGRPRRLPFGGDEIIYYRTVADYRRLRGLTEKDKRFVVIGGGFIGSEIAASLAMNTKEVVMVFPGDGICDRIFPREMSQFLNKYYREKGVELLTNETVTGVEARHAQLFLKTKSGKEIPGAGIIAEKG